MRPARRCQAGRRRRKRGENWNAPSIANVVAQTMCTTTGPGDAAYRAFEGIVAAVPGARVEQVPMLRGRITRLDGTPVEDAQVAQNAQWALRNERGLTYAAAPPKGSRIVAGEWWPPDYNGPPLVSMEKRIADGLGLSVGDSIVVNVLGRNITAKVANLRATGATAIAAANPGCAIQISAHAEQTGEPLRVYHPMELLAESINGAMNGRR